MLHYPYLAPDDITAVLEFAARQNDHAVLFREMIIRAFR